MSIDRIIKPGPAPSFASKPVKPKPEDATPKEPASARAKALGETARVSATAEKEAGAGAELLKQAGPSTRRPPVPKPPVFQGPSKPVERPNIGPGMPTVHAPVPSPPVAGPMPMPMPVPMPMPMPMPAPTSGAPSDAQIQVDLAELLEQYDVSVGDLSPAQWEQLTNLVEDIAQPPLIRQSTDGLDQLLAQLQLAGLPVPGTLASPIGLPGR